MDSARQKRKMEIQKALTFIQSSLPYPEPQGYEDFLTHLVCNLLDEGNASFKDKDWSQAVKDFSEGLNVAHYATIEEINIPEALLESLYVNRATAYHSMGEYELGVQDCDSALEVCKDSCRALYRKALCLKELGRHREAYNCTTECLLIKRLDKPVNELAQELAIQLGLKNRKAYVGVKKETITTKNSAQTANETAVYLGNGLNPLSDITPVTFPSMPQSSIQVNPKSSTMPACYGAYNYTQPLDCQQPAAGFDPLDDSELMGEELDSLLDCLPNKPEPTEAHIQAAFLGPSTYDPSQKSTCVPRVLPNPTSQLPPAFFNSAVSQLNSLDSFSALGGGDGPKASTLDSLDTLSAADGLDALDCFSPGLGAGPGGGASNTELGTPALDCLDDLDDCLDDLDDCLDDLDCCLDDLLDSAPPIGTGKKANKSTTKRVVEKEALEESLDCLDFLEPISFGGGDVPMMGLNPPEPLDSLDALDSFSAVGGATVALPPVGRGAGGLDTLSDFSIPGTIPSQNAAVPAMCSVKKNHKDKISQVTNAVTNPLSFSHEFMQACSACFPREGKSVYSFVHKPDLLHKCKQDILLGTIKADCSVKWTRVRQMPTHSFVGPFVLCRELLNSGDLGVCKYGENCTFAFNQLEIDVWTEERKGTLDRKLLFETPAIKLDPVFSVTQLLQEHKGIFIFLCQLCFDSKPRIISRHRRDNPAVCSNLHVCHKFEDNKCLAYVMKTTTVNYRKIRPLDALCQMDVCRHAIRYGCQREDNCHFAHSLVELKTWTVQRDTGITPEDIVKESAKYFEKMEQNATKQKMTKPSSGAVGGSGSKPKLGQAGSCKSLNMNMKFVCAQCWQNGQINEPDKTLKYCTAKARHIWGKERRVLLVKSLGSIKWVQVRQPPFTKNYPLQYDICAQILEKRKCNYTWNCTFAHSQEEKELWTYMKNNVLKDMQQIYDMWLSLTSPNRQTDVALPSQPEEKYIVMPTDYAEPMSGFHCRLCGKHSNSERQWQRHISTERHKDRVFGCEGEDEMLTWSHRFPGPHFHICPRLHSQCPEGVSCDYAHSSEELQEWMERRDFLRRKLGKAREDMLIMPDEFDFGKYNFLLQD